MWKGEEEIEEIRSWRNDEGSRMRGRRVCLRQPWRRQRMKEEKLLKRMWVLD